jgi:hypothetical protein
MKRLLKEPLLHFLILSLLFFGAYRILHPDGETDQSKVVSISQGRISQLSSMFNKTWSRRPSEEELEKIIEVYALEEIYAREAKSLGLEKDDEVIRSRLRQKMVYLIEDMSALQLPTDDRLQEIYQEKKDKNQLSYKYTFSHIFISADQKKEVIKSKVTAIKEALHQKGKVVGDSTLLPNSMSSVEQFQIDRQFGSNFTDNLKTADDLKWVGPILSGLDYHFIRVDKRVPIEFPPFDKMKESLLTEWRMAKKKTYKADYEKTLLDRYVIKINKKKS